MTKEMKEEVDMKIFLDKEKILGEISKNGQYSTEDIKIRKWEGAEGTESYLVELAKGNIKYNGVINKRFERDGYGIHRFSNGDKYFGFFRDDQRNFNGIYYWPSEEKNGRLYSEMYYGFWKNNNRESNGIYLWLDEPINVKDRVFDNVRLEAYVGNFENNTYSLGTFLQKTDDDYFLYYGKFTPDGHKNDDNGFFYSSNFDRLFHGKIINDEIKEGYVFCFDSESGNIETVIYASFDEKMNITNFILDKDLDQTQKEKESELCSRFRNVILGEDYFGQLYQKVKDITKFVDENLGDVKVFNDNDKFPIMIKLAVAYARDNINIDISEKVFQE